MDTVRFRGFVLKVGFNKGYEVYTEYQVELDGETKHVDVVFIKNNDMHYIEIESGGDDGTSYARDGRERDIKVVSKAGRGFVLVKNKDPGKRLFNETLKQLKLRARAKGTYNNVEILTWKEYRNRANQLH